MKNQEKQPPEAISLNFCPVCGRDDRLKHLRPGGKYPHQNGEGRICPGETVKVIYRVER